MRAHAVLVLLALPALASLLLPAAAPAPAPLRGPGPLDPLTVVAHIDAGLNPYSVEFRWDDARAWQHPCTYIANYPCSAQALYLHLNESDWQTAFDLDRDLWSGVRADTLYWIPGTKIIGDIGMGSLPIPDGQGHGTMTASRSAGNEHSLCPTCLFVSIDGLGIDGVRWAADSGFVDVQTNSWGSLIFVDPALDLMQGALTDAAHKHVVLFASGNGAAGFEGFVSSPTLVMPTGEPGPILVGAHDNGRVLTWPGSPPHVIADGYGGYAALHDSITAIEPTPVACCTSAATPYAAGGAAAIVQEARRILHDFSGPGVHDGVIARAPPGTPLPRQGPLSDGVFTLDEFKPVFFHTATLRPTEGPDDGLLQWAADPQGNLGSVLADPVGYVMNPGANPYCIGCVDTPLQWSQVPAGIGATDSVWTHEGYGAIDPASVALAKQVLRGEVPDPDRPVEDQLYAADQAFRCVWFRYSAPPC
jgi:hypothetical protein